ncbi:hypothetical protein H5410_027455 [Solanum commersonii]|uniref:F-box domain-containing protein n=1 Tax=Solanum commersonii TaxID=4109 RepID=A0A9J5YZ73_SOLCO|nr:hypothetical protein H5410_027455 [Solanum commersonii]
MRIMDLPWPIFRCSTSCKLWYNILSYDPLFVNMYQTRSRKFTCIYLLDGVGKPSFLELKANGLTCFANNPTHIEKHSVYISNPLLGDKVSEKYKVLRLVVREITKLSELEVYTLGVGEKWRNVGEISCPVWYNFGKVNINGSLHWMDSEKNNTIYSFDIKTEKVKSQKRNFFFAFKPLVELENYLCLTDYYNLSTIIDIWWMKEYWIIGKCLHHQSLNMKRIIINEMIPKIQPTKPLKTSKPFCSKEVTTMDVKSSSCKRRRIYHVPRMRIMDLPLVILIEILPRLSIKPIFRCKNVCKLWYNLLSYNPLFVNMYQTRSLKFPCIYLFDDVDNPSILELKEESNYYARHCNKPIQLTPKFHYPLGRLFLVGLCNGFTSFVNVPMHIEKHFVYISNPLLGEHFEVKLPEWEISVCRVTYGFRSSKASGKYKVLRFVVRKLTKVSKLEVYTLGVCEKWRNVGEISCPRKNDIIYSFDIETEKVKSLPALPGLVNPPWNLKLVELGNYLCLTDYYKTLTTNIDIWWMKEYEVSECWTKEIILVDFVPRGMVHINFEPILMWKDGEILIQSGRKLASYNPKMKSFRVVYVYGKVITAITYTPSFYSLKTIMGDDFHLKNVYPKTQIK